MKRILILARSHQEARDYCGQWGIPHKETWVVTCKDDMDLARGLEFRTMITLYGFWFVEGAIEIANYLKAYVR